MFAPAPLPDPSEIRTRLEKIFSEGTADRNYVTRDTAARLVFVMLYIDAIEGLNIWLAPKQVYRMTEAQTNLQDDQERIQYRTESMRPKFIPSGDRWYADNTREPIRDESLRDGLIPKGAVVVRHGLPVTSNKGRYALQEQFARLFLLSDAEFEREVIAWRERYLSASELARIRIMQDRQVREGSVSVKLPNGETRMMAPGPSSLISKAVIEEFASRFLVAPSVLWISESGNKVVLQDDKLMRDLGLPIDQQKLLPDLVLADLGRKDLLLVFVEVVATDGPVTESRKQELLKLTDAAGFPADQVSFVSAFEQRGSQPLKKRFSGIAVDSLIWCMAEPGVLIWLGESKELPFRPGEWIK